MNFVEIVETVEGIESKLDSLSEEKLNLFEAIMSEGSDTEFDVVHHMDTLVEFVNSYSDEQAKIIYETVDCGEVLDVILESVRKHASNDETVISEAVEAVADIDIKLMEEETASVTLLSIVSNVLTEMTSEEEVEKMPVEMVFDIVNEAKELDLADDFNDLDVRDMVAEISTKLEESIKSGSIDFDTEDYEGETLAEFLDDYDNTEEILEEMEKVNDEVLAEAKNEDAARLMGKAKEATVLIEGKMEKCSGDAKAVKACQLKKAKAAKAYFAKGGKMGSGKDPKDIKLTGKLAKHVAKAKKAAVKKGRKLSDEYIQYVLIPGIVKRARKKGQKLGAKASVKKQGMK